MGDASDALKQQRVIAVVQAPEREDLIARAIAAAEGGLRMLAFPVSIPFVAEIAAEVSDRTDVVVGVSDVVLQDQLNVALAAGAEFVISPIFDEELNRSGRDRGMEVIPSVTTLNELNLVLRVHVWPILISPVAGFGGPDYVGRLKRIFPGAELVAGGGVGPDTAPQYLEHGAHAVVVDTGLFPEELDPESRAVITTRAGVLLELCAAAQIGERMSLVPD